MWITEKRRLSLGNCVASSNTDNSIRVSSFPHPNYKNPNRNQPVSGVSESSLLSPNMGRKKRLRSTATTIPYLEQGLLLFLFSFIFICDHGTCEATALPEKNNDSNFNQAKNRTPTGVLKPFARTPRNSFVSEKGPRYRSNNSTEDFEDTRYWKKGHCMCWNSSSGHNNSEIECKCSGPNFTKFSATTLPPDVHRLTVEFAKDFTTLGNDDLRPYAGTLSELVLSELPQFSEFKSGTFHGMQNLDTIYIHGAHSLKEIPDDIFKVYLPNLKAIRITYSGLEVAPNLSQLHVKAELHMVELENAKISKILPGSFKNLKTEHLSLAYNELREIGPKAFEGASIARLGLNGNRQLTTLHPEAFVGIEHLRVLDLSETSITYLPNHGLKGLGDLRLEKVWTLSVIPSIYHFPSLRVASLTWPYHCCAFEFPETHDPVAFEEYQEYVRSAVQQLCDKASANTTDSTTTQGQDTISHHPHRISTARKKRQAGWTQYWKPSAINPPYSSYHTTNSMENIGIGTRRALQVLRRNRANRKNRAAAAATPPTRTSESGSPGSQENVGSEEFGDLDKWGKRFEHKHDGHRQPEEYEADDPEEHYEEHDHHNSFDPYVFDPERSFGSVFDPNDLEKDSDITGSSSWDHFGHETESEIDEEIGVFHHSSVDPSPTVITLCGNVSVKKPPKVYCRPLPDAFNPCEDIMGSLWLRGAVWIVVSLALIGNTAVLVVLLLAPGRMSVQRFLMANLSCADLCMGLYLLMVATQDIVSLGSYFNYAIDWQLGWGCQIAGFLTVFASELSVFTLAIITGERWYALTRAIHLTKRLTIVGAAQLMSVGWILSMILAALPLVGVSSYSKTSICLPMEATTVGSVVYLSFLLLFNGLAFLVVATAYWQMYRAVAGHGGGAASAPGASSADTAIAKKMALLVFTDFACWAPVAFFGLTAVGGYPLIGVTDSKILLVFFYPLNSTLNPYLYAIMTKQYRRDLLLLLSRHGICTRRAARYKTGGVSTNNTLQTMQTVLRLGSLTETKVAQPHHNSPNGGGRISVGNVGAGGSDLRTGAQQQLLPNLGSLESPLLLQNNSGGISASSPQLGEAVLAPHQIFDYPLHPNLVRNSTKNDGKVKNQLDLHTSDEEDNVNSFDGRLLAETSFISVPAPPSIKMGMAVPLKKVGGSNSEVHMKLMQQDSTQSPEDEEHEISENTPFCSKN